MATFDELLSYANQAKNKAIGVQNDCNNVINRANTYKSQRDAEVAALTAERDALQSQLDACNASLSQCEADLAACEGEPPPPPPPPPSTLTPSGPVSSTASGQIIENLDITASGDGVTITHSNVTVRNCRIRHGGRGINTSAGFTRVEGCEIEHTNPPAGQAGYVGPDSHINIRFNGASDGVVLNCELRHGSTGIYLINSPRARVEHCTGFNFHGDFPRGQFVQFNGSGGSVLTQFYCFNDPANSRPEDNVSVYNSPNTEVSWGVIDGNNSRTGDGVLVENNSTGVVVHHVDTIHQANGGYGTYAVGTLFDVTRNFDHITVDQGRGPAASNYLMWNASAANTRIRNSTYTRGSNNVVWNQNNIIELSLTEDPAAVAMTPIANTFPWNA